MFLQFSQISNDVHPLIEVRNQLIFRLRELGHLQKDEVEFIRKDGSWGVHAPRYAVKRMDAAVTYVTQAEAIADGKGTKTASL